MRSIGRWFAAVVALAASGYSSRAESEGPIPSIMSLIFDESADTERDPKVVSFPFNPSVKEEKQWLLWKASAGGPVLVWDPERSEKVQTGNQVIGTWGFGGKDEGDGRIVPWKDGYESLAYLDRNLDGEISGLELRGLGLWFDRNRNGVCDVGEYSPVGLKGVTLIRLRPERHDEATGRKWSTQGFQYVRNGVTFTGWTVSWPTRVSANKGELEAVVAALPTPCSKGDDDTIGTCKGEGSGQTLGSIETHYR